MAVYSIVLSDFDGAWPREKPMVPMSEDPIAPGIWKPSRGMVGPIKPFGVLPFYPQPYLPQDENPIPEFISPTFFALSRIGWPKDPVNPEADMSVLDPTTMAFEDNKNPAWRDIVGPPRRWMVYSGRQLRITPKSVVNLKVGTIEQPALLALDGDTPDTRIPIPHHLHLKYAAAAFLLRMDGDNQDEAGADGFMKVFNSLITH
jgi:hypothetical protein